MRNFHLAIVMSASLAGCYAATSPSVVAVSADANADLIEISPGVEVVTDYGLPVFFADDYYWSQRGGIWYWSTWYGGAWTRAPHVPPYVARIPHPESYAHYRPNGWVHRGPSGTEHGFRGGGVTVRSRPAPHGGRRH